MPLIPMHELLADATQRGYAVGYFEAWDLYSLEAVKEAAEEMNSPAILGFGGVMMNQEWIESGGMRALGEMGRVVATNTKVPTVYLLNEVLSFDHITQGLVSGFNAVMLDTSHIPFEENISITRRVVDTARRFDADVEGECDPLPDASGYMGEHGGSRMTDPEDASRFVEETGICALSISIGNEHIKTDGKSSTDFELLSRINQKVSVPLVLHGGTGFADADVPRAIELGVAKFNIGSIMKKLYLESVCEIMISLPDKPDFQELVGSHKYGDFLQIAKQRVKAEVKRRIAVYKSADKA